MDALKAELARKRKERASSAETGAAPAAGKRRFVSRGAMEREREARERRERDAGDGADGTNNKARSGAGNGASGSGRAEKADAKGEAGEAELTEQEVKRRLRLLKQPATLFGEVHATRHARLKRVEKELVVEDTYAVGQQANVLLEIQREEEQERQRMLRKEAALKEKQSKAKGADGGKPSQELVQMTEAKRLEAQFRAAAARVAAEKQEAEMSVDAAIESYTRRMLAEWEQEVSARPEEVKRTPEGTQQTQQFRVAERSFGPLFERLQKGTLPDDVKAALWIIVKSMKERNYMYASEIYVKLAIGNAPWPIGVTSVGIHERSAREKISFSMNGQAHIMNDEATRKFIHAFKRLMTFVQRAYPTDPSRCLEFNARPGEGSSDLKSLLAAERRGEKLRLADTPHFIGSDGAVKAPVRWMSILKSSGLEKVEITEQNVKDKRRGFKTT